MNVKKIFSPRILLCLIILVVMTVFVIGSDVYVDSVKSGLTLYVACVLPATFPFFFFSKLLTELNFAGDLTGLTEKPMRKLFRAPPIGGYVLIMSLLCGYPIGAKLLSEFCSHGLITEEEAKRISAFTSTGGPIFIIGTVGVAMFDNKTYGFILLLSHYIGTFLNGIVFRGKKRSVSSFSLPDLKNEDVLQKSMTETFLSIGVVGGFIVLFNLIVDMIDHTNLFAPFVRLLSLLKIPSRLSEAFLFGLIEMTRGCKMLSALSYPVYVLLPCCAFLLTFGGSSVSFQSLTYLAKIKISPAYYILTKITQGIFSAITAFLLSCLLILL